MKGTMKKIIQKYITTKHDKIQKLYTKIHHNKTQQIHKIIYLFIKEFHLIIMFHLFLFFEWYPCPNIHFKCIIYSYNC